MNLLPLLLQAPSRRRRRASACRCCSRMSAPLGRQSDLVAQAARRNPRVIAKHVQIDHDKVSVKMERGEKVSTLEVDVEIPFQAAKAAAKKKAA